MPRNAAKPRASGTAISWTNETWNPVTGCSHVSDGCRNCYAEKLSLRFGWSRLPWTANNAAENVILHPERLRMPQKWPAGTRIFVNSMSDLFHELVPFDYIDQVFEVMEQHPEHIYQVLTKRPERMAEYVWGRYRGAWADRDRALAVSLGAVCPPHIWLGTSIEDGRVLDRLDALERCPAAVKFVSAEPLIGPLSARFRDWPEEGWPHVEKLGEYLAGSGVAWVIAGGESGPGFRPMDHAWAREIRDACVAHGIAFFFKQSANYYTERGTALEEEDGTRWRWQQYPGALRAPEQVGS